MMPINSTLANRSDDLYYDSDRFPLSYEDHDVNTDLINQTYYDDFLLNENSTLSINNGDLLSLSSIFSLSSPFSYILLILCVYLILTLILLSFSLYKQRQTDIENFYFGDTDEDVQQAKRTVAWKQLLIGKIRKGDMEPLLMQSTSDADVTDDRCQSTTFPLHVV